MKEITLHKDLVYSGFNIIANRYQRIAQYDNKGARLFHKNGAVVYVEDDGACKTEYLLDKKETRRALKDPDIFISRKIWEWITNSDDPMLSYYQWYPEALTDRYTDGESCRVLIVGCYYGYEPIQWAKNDAGEDIIFDTPALAQEWIEEQEKGPYYLQHGEAGRPDYFIIS